MKYQENVKTLLKILFQAQELFLECFCTIKITNIKSMGENRLDHIEV